MTTRELLLKAREIIAKPEHWSKGANCRDADGEPCHPSDDSKAVSWCLYGAVDRIGLLLPEEGDEALARAHTVACRALTGVIERRKRGMLGRQYTGPAGFNDAPETTHDDVLAVLDEAIEEAPEFEEQYERNRASV